MKKLLLLFLYLASAVSSTYCMAPPMPPAPPRLQAVLQGILNHHATGQGLIAPAISAQVETDTTASALSELWNTDLIKLKNSISYVQKMAAINPLNSNDISEACLNTALEKTNTPDQQKQYYKASITALERESIRNSALYHATTAQIDHRIKHNKIIYSGIIPSTAIVLLLAGEHYHKENKTKSLYSQYLSPFINFSSKHINNTTTSAAGILGLLLYSAHQTGFLRYLKNNTLPQMATFLWNHRTNIMYAPVNTAITIAQKPGKVAQALSWPAVLLLVNWIARGEKSLIGHASKHGTTGLIWSMFDQVRSFASGTADLFKVPTTLQQA